MGFSGCSARTHDWNVQLRLWGQKNRQTVPDQSRKKTISISIYSILMMKTRDYRRSPILKAVPVLQYSYDDKGHPTQLMSGSDVLVKDVLYDAVSGKLVPTSIRCRIRMSIWTSNWALIQSTGLIILWPDLIQKTIQLSILIWIWQSSSCGQGKWSYIERGGEL